MGSLIKASRETMRWIYSTIAVGQLGGPLGQGNTILINPLQSEAYQVTPAALLHEILHNFGQTDLDLATMFGLNISSGNTAAITDQIQKKCF